VLGVASVAKLSYAASLIFYILNNHPKNILMTVWTTSPSHVLFRTFC